MVQQEQDFLVRAPIAAKALGISTGTLYKIAREEGGCPGVYGAGRKRGGVRFSIQELREAMRRNSNQCQSKP